jgi:hypothetical protein
MKDPQTCQFQFSLTSERCRFKVGRKLKEADFIRSNDHGELSGNINSCTIEEERQVIDHGMGLGETESAAKKKRPAAANG